MKTETIAAIASAMTNSGIGIIRISGEDAFDVIDKIYRSQKGNKLLSQCKSHTIHYGHIYDEDEIIDEVMVLLMRAPNSYTREDTVEIDCHGGVFAMQRVLETVLKNGAEIAEPGEFTKRAFLNGRVDLSHPQNIKKKIKAKNEYALRSSMDQLRGSVQKAIREIREKLIYHIAYIESALDDPEHISLDGYPQELLEVVDNEQKEVKRLLKTSSDGKMIQEGIQTVILGKPNAGKSSLLNALVGRERAIVTDIAGTTRDVLEEQINLNGITLNIMDTAGIRSTKDVVEKIGVDKALSLVDKADFIIYVVDTSTALDENDEKIIDAIREKKAIILLNKSDLTQVTGEDEIKEKLSGADHKMIAISAKENLGIDVLEETITEMFFHGTISFNDEVYITNIRHKNALIQAVESLKLVKQSVKNGMPEDFYSIDLMNAYEELGTIIGEAVEDDLVNEIFSKFCMGK